MTDPTLAPRVQQWIAEEPDPETRAAAEQMVAAGAWDALAACFGAPPSFGTAGIRAPLGPGPSRMNRSTVRRVAAGLATALAEHVPGDGPVVIGYDARRGSASFAADAARVLSGAGVRVLMFDGVVPTPLLAWSVRDRGARAGVMITASHNPPDDNGIKVYGGDGAQIVPPFDAAIEEGARAVASVAALPLGPPPAPVPADTVDRYVRNVLALRVHPNAAPVRVAYTPLHGVGAATVTRVLAAAGYTDVHVVAAQAEPDGRFPTLPFPNPEEPGALDHLITTARACDAPIALANDPDADRIAVAVRTDAGYRALTGNEIGTLLADDLLRHRPRPTDGPPVVATTVVSSTLLASIAAGAGATCVRTWTGFKWIARAAADAPGRFVLGYEEALGVCAGEVIRDKDGVSAALLLADLASHLAAEGRTLVDAIDALHVHHGVHLGAQVTVKLPVPRITAMMAALRARRPPVLGDRPVQRWIDHLVEVPQRLPPANLLVAALGGRDRALFRPSGTEPKLKVYLEVVEDVGGDGLAAARARAEARLDVLRRAVTELADALAASEATTAP